MATGGRSHQEGSQKSNKRLSWVLAETATCPHIEDLTRWASHLQRAAVDQESVQRKPVEDLQGAVAITATVPTSAGHLLYAGHCSKCFTRVQSFNHPTR